MLQGVENVYTQHTPPLVGLLERLAKAKLPEIDYPRVERDSSPHAPRVRSHVGLGWPGAALGKAAHALPAPTHSTLSPPDPASFNHPALSPQPPRLVVAFIIGGTTYEEARAVAELNAAGERGEGWSAGTRLVLGGTSVQSSASFLKDLQEVMLNERYAT